MTIHETYSKASINKTWEVCIYADNQGFIESEKKGVKKTFRLGDNGIYGNLEGIPYSVITKANSLAKKLWNDMNRKYRFSESRMKNGKFGLTQY